MAYQKIIHLSDIHIRSESKPEMGRFLKAISVIGKYYSGWPVLITGDVTDSATKPQMQRARKCIERLAKTNIVLPVPGNHDYGVLGNFFRWEAPMNWTETLGRPFGPGVTSRRWMSAEEDPLGVEGIGVFENNFCVFIGLDSGDPFNEERLARGLITEKLANALQTTLNKYRDKVRVVFLHHHPFTDNPFLALNGSKRLMKVLKGNCELLLFGHEHNIGAWWGRNQIPLTMASHKTTSLVTGTHMLISIIEIVRDADSKLDISHSLKVVS